MLFLFAALLGLGIGSFLNVVIIRLHSNEPLTGRSHCVYCQKQLRWFELLPVVSFVALGGRCRYCQQAISWQYPLVELITAAVFATITVWFSTDPLRLGVYLVYSAILIVLFVYDARYYLIPDIITLPAIIFSIIISLLLGNHWLNIMLALAVGSGVFLLQYVASGGRWIGGGDIRLGALMGAMLGWPNIVVALFLAYCGGAIVAVTLMILGKKKMTDRLPFGTFLSASTIITLCLGNQLVYWYLYEFLRLYHR
ncbi:MAG: prepilin peptidase [Candidatus Kerfeldbacteria bacterium]|nr:prepilin peptidase [Candidatus Kerfeldbacteria bacterium]